MSLRLPVRLQSSLQLRLIILIVLLVGLSLEGFAQSSRGTSSEKLQGDLQKPWHGQEIAQLDDGVVPQGRITYKLNSGWQNWPEEKREKIITSMDEALWLYNRYGRFEKQLRVAYKPSVKTADANINGQIRFGKQISTRTALHEISHTLGIGTARKWDRMLEDKTWQGHNGNRMLQAFDGHESVVKGDKNHFWPYGMNYPKDDGPERRIRHVLMVEALCRDMDLPVFAQQ